MSWLQNRGVSGGLTLEGNIYRFFFAFSGWNCCMLASQQWRLHGMDIQKELIAEYDRETAKTRKMLEAIPEDADYGWKPHSKSMSLGQLAGHLVETAGQWADHTLTMDKLEFPADHKFEQYIPASKKALLERYDGEVAKVKKELADFAPRSGTRTGSLWLAGRPGSMNRSMKCGARGY
jgi:uncharacterized damage-inducible protein DinB